MVRTGGFRKEVEGVSQDQPFDHSALGAGHARRSIFRACMVGLVSAMTSRTVVVRAWEAPDDSLPELDGQTGPVPR